MSPAATSRWSLADRARDLSRAEREGVELLVVGGGITGAGVLRDAATRGMRAFLVERGDFASGTSSASSKLIHGGLRYIAEGQLSMTRQACRERDLLVRLNPHLVCPLRFVFPAYDDSRIPHWQVRAALWTYAALANFRRTSRFRMLNAEEVRELLPDLRIRGLRGAGLFSDAQVDDARLVLETLRSARSLGCAAANYAELVEFLRGDEGRIVGARIRDTLAGRTLSIRAEVVVNAAGPAVERVRGLDGPVERPELRPAKGVHLVIPQGRIRAEVAVTFEAADRRQLFLAPWGDVALLGTTDTFTEEIDEPVATIEEVHYLLAAANAAFPCIGLTTNDLRSVFAGVRPLAADPDEDVPASSVSREHRIFRDSSGLLSTLGGKLTTYRAMGEGIVDEAVCRLPESRQRALSRSRTAELPLRVDDFDRESLEDELCRRFELTRHHVARLVRTYGEQARTLLEEARSELRCPIGDSRYVLAEIAWSVATECPATLCDLLERRLRMAVFAVGQGLTEISRIAPAAAAAADWDPDRTRAEIEAYAASVRRRYQIAAPGSERSAA